MGGGSWTINLSWLRPGVDRIKYITLVDTYTISLKDALLHGFNREFNGENKLIVPLEYWNYSRKPKPVEKPFVPAVEKCKKSIQTSIFDIV
jgi:hypothetical protein